MPSLVLWILWVYGIAFLLADSKIFGEWIPVRPLFMRWAFFRDLLRCYFCMGVWISAGSWLLFAWPRLLWREALLYSMAGAVGAFLVDLGATAIEALVISRLREDSDG